MTLGAVQPARSMSNTVDEGTIAVLKTTHSGLSGTSCASEVDPTIGVDSTPATATVTVKSEPDDAMIPAIFLDADLSEAEPDAPPKPKALSTAPFRQQRAHVMSIIVKYIASKIQTSFPAEIHVGDVPQIPLERFLLLLTARLKLSLVLFMKGVIYLFRYMDIVYLLRYLNQSNNSACVMEMDYGLRKLVVGCFKLALVRERKLDDARSTAKGITRASTMEPKYDQNWTRATGLAAPDIGEVVRRIISRLNGKLAIKNIELARLKHELYRFVKMVSE